MHPVRTRGCWGVLPGSMSVTRRSPPQRTAAVAMRSQTKLLGSTPWQHVRVTKVSTRAHSRGNYSKPAAASLLQGSDAISLQTTFC